MTVVLTSTQFALDLDAPTTTPRLRYSIRRGRQTERSLREFGSNKFGRSHSAAKVRARPKKQGPARKHAPYRCVSKRVIDHKIAYLRSCSSGTHTRPRARLVAHASFSGSPRCWASRPSDVSAERAGEGRQRGAAIALRFSNHHAEQARRSVSESMSHHPTYGRRSKPRRMLQDAATCHCVPAMDWRSRAWGLLPVQRRGAVTFPNVVYAPHLGYCSLGALV